MIMFVVYSWHHGEAGWCTGLKISQSTWAMVLLNIPSVVENLMNSTS